MKKLFLFLVLLFLLFQTLTGFSTYQKDLLKKVPTPTQITLQEEQNQFYPVVKVVDGDTIDVRIEQNVARVRLIGIDTPEVVDPRKPVQCFGKEASDKAKGILTGKSVRLESDPTQGDKDKYGRLLRYVFLEDGTLFNKLMIEQGYAHEYTYHSNPYKYQLEFIAAERSAREQNLGLWNSAACR